MRRCPARGRAPIPPRPVQLGPRGPPHGDRPVLGLADPSVRSNPNAPAPLNEMVPLNETVPLNELDPLNQVPHEPVSGLIPGCHPWAEIFAVWSREHPLRFVYGGEERRGVHDDPQPLPDGPKPFGSAAFDGHRAPGGSGEPGLHVVFGGSEFG
jgi:hypothetical protein